MAKCRKKPNGKESSAKGAKRARRKPVISDKQLRKNIEKFVAGRTPDIPSTWMDIGPRKVDSDG